VTEDLSGQNRRLTLTWDHPIELAMVETFNAQYVSLHVRVSNGAAIHLYRDTLGFKTEKTEAKYYADGEDAYCMKLDLKPIRDQISREQEEEKEGSGESGTEKTIKSNEEDGGSGIGSGDKKEPVDEGEPVGDVGSADMPKDEMVKVKIGRPLGLSDLVEKDESKKTAATQQKAELS